MDSETGTEIDRQGEEDKEKHRHGDRDWGQGQIYRQTWTEGQGQKIEALRKGQRNMDSDSGTWTRSGTERQGHNHRDWDKRQEQVQTEGHQ